MFFPGPDWPLFSLSFSLARTLYDIVHRLEQGSNLPWRDKVLITPHLSDKVLAVPQRPTPTAGWQAQSATGWEGNKAWGQGGVNTIHQQDTCVIIFNISTTVLSHRAHTVSWDNAGGWYSQPAFTQNVSCTVWVHCTAPHPQRSSFLWGKHENLP